MNISMPITDMELPDKRDARTFSRAMLLQGGPVSPEGNALVDMIVDDYISPVKAARGKVGSASDTKHRKITGAFLADLLMAARLGAWSKRATNHKALVGIPGGATAFTAMRGALGAAGLIDELPGYLRNYEQFGVKQSRAARTSFRPTEGLLKIAEDLGITLTDVPLHFAIGEPEVPVPETLIEKREAKRTKDAAPKAVTVDADDPKASVLIEDMQRLNAHLMQAGRIEGITFAGLRRVFSNADLPEFAWQWHGRYYSMPHADRYENMEGGAEARGKIIRIDGQPVVEVDISASHLTILHGLLGLPFDTDRDPYEACDPGLVRSDTTPSGRGHFDLSASTRVEREKMKAWLLVALGSSNAAVGGPKHNKARRAGLERYPFLANLQTLGIGPLDLQYHEAEIMRLAMDELVDQGIGFLPVHDALMVATGNVELARQALRNAFITYFTETLGIPSAPVPRVT